MGPDVRIGTITTCTEPRKTCAFFVFAFAFLTFYDLFSAPCIRTYVQAGEEAKKYPFDAIHDTEAFVAANDDIVAVVFRGTKEKADWAANLNAQRRECPETWGADSGALHEVRRTV